MNLTKQQITTKMNSAKIVDALKLNADENKVKNVINLKAEQVKGNKTNRIFVSDKLKK